MKQLVNTKNGLEEIDVSLAECLTDVAKNWYKELHAEYETETGVKLHVLSSGVIFKDEDWNQDWIDTEYKIILPKNYAQTINRIKGGCVDYSKAIPTVLDPQGQKLKLNIDDLKGVVVHQIVAKAFYGSKDLKNMEIHHRDNNALNNQLWNLIPLQKSDHDVITNEGTKMPK